MVVAFTSARATPHSEYLIHKLIIIVIIIPRNCGAAILTKLLGCTLTYSGACVKHVLAFAPHTVFARVTLAAAVTL